MTPYAFLQELEKVVTEMLEATSAIDKLLCIGFPYFVSQPFKIFQAVMQESVDLFNWEKKAQKDSTRITKMLFSDYQQRKTRIERLIREGMEIRL